LNSVLAAVELLQEQSLEVYMYRRYREYRQRRRRSTERRPRSMMKRPGVQVAILIIVALVIYLILQSGGGGGNSLPGEIGVQSEVPAALTAIMGIYSTSFL
jgi:hypothetical protein